jgi:hypothetical protein
MKLNHTPALGRSPRHDLRHTDAMHNAIRVVPGSTGITILHRDGTVTYINNGVDDQETGSRPAGWHS